MNEKELMKKTKKELISIISQQESQYKSALADTSSNIDQLTTRINRLKKERDILSVKYRKVEQELLEKRCYKAESLLSYFSDSIVLTKSEKVCNLVCVPYHTYITIGFKNNLTGCEYESTFIVLDKTDDGYVAIQMCGPSFINTTKAFVIPSEFVLSYSKDATGKLSTIVDWILKIFIRNKV